MRLHRPLFASVCALMLVCCSANQNGTTTRADGGADAAGGEGSAGGALDAFAGESGEVDGSTAVLGDASADVSAEVFADVSTDASTDVRTGVPDATATADVAQETSAEAGAETGAEAGTIDVAMVMDVVPEAAAEAGPEASVMDVQSDGPLVCTGTHPLLDAGARYCGAGDCYCPLPGARGDTCFPLATAAACCQGRTVTCYAAGGPTTCSLGTHPLLDAGARFCAPGDCYCAPQDSCRPASAAAACCPVPVRCP